MLPLDRVTELIVSRKAHIGVIGLGYVGLPLLLRFSISGFKAIGFDSDVKKIDQIKSGKSYITHIADSKIIKAQKAGLSATNDYRVCAQCDVLILCLPTPLTEDRKPDLSYVLHTVKALSPHLRSGQLISLESTTYPGTTEEEILPLISQSELTVGRELFLVYSPEREDPANTDFDFFDIPKLVAGHTAACLEAGISLYQTVVRKVVPMQSTKAAELTKLLENVQRSVNIGLMNEMKLVADRMNIDIFDVVEAASTKPFGFSTFYPGPGLGGHCIPIDPYYLTYKANLLGINTRFIELSGEINRAMPAYVVNKLCLALAERHKELSNSKVLVMGLSYKKNIGDPRESPAMAILDLLTQGGAEVSYSDPFFPTFPFMKNYSYSMSSVNLTATAIRSFDSVLLVTDHDCFDYELVQLHAQLIVDTRGRYRELSDQIVRA
jgi:UDP-N-acetyl-D-glucosamine dehydrogenase